MERLSTMSTMLFTFSVLVAILIGGTSLSWLGMIPSVTWSHFVLAAGVMPLSITAIIFFASVLARRQVSTGQLKLLPGIMFIAGCLASAAAVHLLNNLFAVLAGVMILASLWHLNHWIDKKKEPAGMYHPTLDWYRAALLCLGGGVIAALLVPFLPEWWTQLDTFHARISLYGFFGLAAVGTLQFLMSAVTNRPDPLLGRRLKTGLPWALSGVAMMALGDFLQPWGHALGVGFLAWPLARVLGAWCLRYRRDVFALHGAAPMLCATLLGFAASLAGMLTAPGLPSGMPNIFMPGFIFPLVSGAASYLLPAWKEARQRPTTGYIRDHRLNHWGGVRAMLFLLAALTPFLGFDDSVVFGLAGLIWFEVALVRWVLSADGPSHGIKHLDVTR